MQQSVLFFLAILLTTGLLFGKLARLVKMPDVTGYLVGGLIIGPYVLRIISENTANSLNIISDVALGFIAFSIGSEFKFSYFKRVGITPIVIAITEGLGAVVFVTCGLLVLGQELSLSLLLGAIASATAPAATIMVVRQYKARGPVTETLLSVVALDDAVALIAFGFAVTATKTLTSQTEGSLTLSILKPFAEVFLAVGIGLVLGFVFTFLLRFFRLEANRLCLIVAFVFMGIALASLLGISSLLLCMAMGAAFVNVYRSSAEVMKIADTVTPPVFMIFFVLSGAQLNLSVLPTVGVVGIAYILLRVLGKVLGASFGGIVTRAPAAVRKFLGSTLIPQAGVAIGLSLVAQTAVPDHASVIRAVVLCGTLIYEIVGPTITKLSLKKAGEITDA